MTYVGIQTQIDKNNRNSVLLLLSFPLIVFGMMWVFCCVFGFRNGGYDYETGSYATYFDIDLVNSMFLESLPWAAAIVGGWLVIAYMCNVKIIQHATGARPLERRENPRVYNIVENLCMTCGMDMPKINIINDSQLNAFASGISKDTYTVTLTTGIIDMLNDEELAGVVGHELTHIRNNDTRVLIISIVFVGILSTLLSLLTSRVMLRIAFSMMGNGRSNKKEGGGLAVAGIAIILAAIICSAIAYFLAMLTRFAISRKREFMADAGGAELCGNPLALASALRKISRAPGLGDVNRSDIAQLYIINPVAMAQGFMDKLQNMFSTHPDTAERIRILEQF